MIEGLKLEVLTSILPTVNEKNTKINATYRQPNVHTVASLDVFKVSKRKKECDIVDIEWVLLG